jgi:transcriptional regulator with XRE-family HTH domain
MHFITFLRTSLNSSLGDFARFFNVSKATLFRVEKDMSQLPDGSNDILKLIHDRLMETDQSVKKKPLEIVEMEAEMLRRLEFRNNEIALALIKMQNELDEMAARYQAAKIAHRYTSAILANPGNLSAAQKGWLIGHLGRQELQMQRTDRMARYLLEVRIAQLELEMKMNRGVTK